MCRVTNPEGEVTQGETEGFDRSDRVLLGKSLRHAVLPALLWTLQIRKRTLSPFPFLLLYLTVYLTVDVKR